MVDKDYPRQSVAAQCRLLSIPRSTFYHRPAGETAENLALMQVIDRPFMETPFFGARQMTWHLGNEGQTVNPKRVRRLMRLRVKGTVAPVGPRKPRNDADLPTSEHQPPGEGTAAVSLSAAGSGDRPPKPGLVRGHHLHSNAAGLFYLVAIMDWHSRRVLSWRLSNTLEAEFCADALAEAIERAGPPEIMNTDPGSQFTAFAWTDPLRKAGIRISMDGKGRFLDTIFIERRDLVRLPIGAPSVRAR